jgi:hypothetical protein
MRLADVANWWRGRRAKEELRRSLDQSGSAELLDLIDQASSLSPREVA